MWFRDRVSIHLGPQGAQRRRSRISSVRGGRRGRIERQEEGKKERERDSYR